MATTCLLPLEVWKGTIARVRKEGATKRIARNKHLMKHKALKTPLATKEDEEDEKADSWVSKESTSTEEHKGTQLDLKYIVPDNVSNDNSAQSKEPPNGERTETEREGVVAGEVSVPFSGFSLDA